MSITASDHKIRGRSITDMVFDEWQYMAEPMSTNIDDYEIRRLGYKDYGIYLKNAKWARTIVRYACSHTEAKRRWALKLITHRLTG